MQMEFIKAYGFQPKEFEANMARFKKERGMPEEKKQEVVRVVAMHPMEKLQLILLAGAFSMLSSAIIAQLAQ